MKKIRVIKLATSTIKDKKSKKNMEALIDYMYDDIKEVIIATVKARLYIKHVYGLETPQKLWDDILQSVIERDRQKKDKQHE